MNERLDLKWGTVKGWSDLSESSVEILKDYFSDGVPLSAMADNPSADRREILCRLIDNIDGEIWNNWDGCQMNKDQAKAYVREYGATK